MEDALRQIGLSTYLFVPVSDLKGEQKNARFVEVSVGTKGWKAFFEVDADGFMPSLEDCVFFSQNFDFMALRTGFVEHTIYAGSESFLLSATGVDVGKETTVVVGSHWPETYILNYYSPRIRSP